MWTPQPLPAHPIPCPLGRVRELLWTIDLGLDGCARRFVFDLGAGVTSVDTRLAGILGLRPTRSVSGERMTGARVEVGLCEPRNLELGGHRFLPPHLGVLDFASLLPPDWPRIDGVLALDALAGLPFTLDSAQGALILESEASLATRGSAAAAVRIRVEHQIEGVSLVVFVPVRSRSGADLWFELDSGNVGAAVVAPGAAEALGLTDDDGTAALGVGGLAPTPVAYVRKAIRYDGNLGQAFLRGRRLTLDLRRPAAWISGPAEGAAATAPSPSGVSP